MGNVFKINVLRYMPKRLVFLIAISVVFVLYFSLNTLNIQINLIGNLNEKIFSIIKAPILFLLLLKTEKGIIRHFVSAFVVFLGLNFIPGLTLNKSDYLFSVLFFLVLLIFFSESQPNFLREKSMRIILHIRK